MSEDTEKPTAAWRAAAARLIEVGYDPAAVYDAGQHRDRLHCSVGNSG
jgi:hypothetical protein